MRLARLFPALAVGVFASAGLAPARAHDQMHMMQMQAAHRSAAPRSTISMQTGETRTVGP